MIDLAITNGNESILSFYPSSEISEHVLNRLKKDWSCLSILISNPYLVTDDILKYVCEKFIENKSFSNDILTLLTLRPEADRNYDHDLDHDNYRINKKATEYKITDEPNLDVKDPLEMSSSELFLNLNEETERSNKSNISQNSMLDKIPISSYTQIIKLLLRKNEWCYKTEDDKNKILTILYDLTSAVQTKIEEKERIQNRTVSQMHNERARSVYNSAGRRGSILMARKLWKEGSNKIIENLRANKNRQDSQAVIRSNSKVVKKPVETDFTTKKEAIKDAAHLHNELDQQQPTEAEILQEFYDVLGTAAIFLINNLPNVKILNSLSRYFSLFAQVLRIEGTDHSEIMKLLGLGGRKIIYSYFLYFSNP